MNRNLNNIFMVLIVSLLGCGNSATENVVEKKVTSPVESTSAIQQNNGKSLGSFTKNSSAMPFKDSIVRWNKDEKKLKIILTPSVLPTEEKEKINNGESVFSVLVWKDSPDPAKWQWYPYVKIELTFETEEINAEGVKFIYVMAYGIEEKNMTDNLNTFLDDKNIFDHITWKDGKLSIKYRGSGSITESKYSWQLEM